MPLDGHAMTNWELMKYVRLLKIRNFRGVFSRDELSLITPHKNETGILNLDVSGSSGTHWVAFSKKNNNITYFDSYGLRPPPEVLQYFKGNKINYSNEKLQNYNSPNCGQLCLKFLIKEVGQ